MEHRIGRRRATRVALEAKARGRTFPARLYDVSLTGCRFDCSESDLCNGDKIVFKFADEVKVSGKIVWRHRGAAGVKFARSLPQSIADHLDLKQANASTDA